MHSFASFIFSSSSFSLLSHCVVANKTPARWYRVKYIAQGIVGFFFSFSLSAVCTTFVCCFNLNVIFSLSLTLLAHLFAFYFARRCKGRPECNLECKQMINSAKRYFSMLRQLLLFAHITLSLKLIFWIGFCILIDLPFHLHLNRQWRCCCCGSSLFFSQPVFRLVFILKQKNIKKILKHFFLLCDHSSGYYHTGYGNKVRIMQIIFFIFGE